MKPKKMLMKCHRKRLFELAKELGLRPPEMVKKLNDLGLSIKSAGMTLDDAQEKIARENLCDDKVKAEEINVVNSKKSTTKSKKDITSKSKQDELHEKRLAAI